MTYDLDEISFEEDSHTYRNPAGVVVPSVTQTLALAGIFDYSMVPPELLERKRIIGTNVHGWSAWSDTLAPLQSQPRLTDEEFGYAEGWVKFVSDVRPRFINIEGRMMGYLSGLELAGTPDRIAIIRNRLWVLDIKCSSCNNPGWALQTADYEMLHCKRSFIGFMGRMIVRLSSKGTYNTLTYSDPTDAAASIAALAIAHDPFNQSARDTIEAWKSNHRIKEREPFNAYRNESSEEFQTQRPRLRPRDYDSAS